MITTEDCDTFATSARDSLAWSECDDEPYFQDYDDEPYQGHGNIASNINDEPDCDVQPSSRWRWALAIGAWTVGAAALTVAVSMAFVTFTPQHPPTPPQPSTVTLTGLPIVPNDSEPARNT